MLPRRWTRFTAASGLFQPRRAVRISRNTLKEYKRTGQFVLGTCIATGLGFYGLQAGLDVAYMPHTLGAIHFNKDNSFTTSPRIHEGRGVSASGSPYGSTEDVNVAIEELRKALPWEGAVNVNPDALELHGYSPWSYHPTAAHSVIVKPRSTEDVVKIVNISRKFRVPIVAYSGATSLEGHFSGYPSGSICVDMCEMNKIVSINEADGDLTCQAGVYWNVINQVLRDKGIPLFFPIDPGPGASIGGMIGTGCSGTNAVRYGTAKGEWFLNLTVVLPNGEVIKTRRNARKSAAGWDTSRLFIGAEGTLGIVTEVTLRLAPVIPSRVAMAQFPDVWKAVSAVEEILNTPYGPHIQCVELLDDNMMAAINSSGSVEKSLAVADTLFFRIQGPLEGIQAAAETVKRVVEKHGSNHFEYAPTEQAAEDLWYIRKYSPQFTMDAATGYKLWVTDVCVPVSRLPQLVYETKKDLIDANIKHTILGHVGDGNFHALLLFKNDEELKLVHDAVHRIIKRAISLDGTCTGEHGVGLGKKRYLAEELGEGTVELMRTVKRAIDPLNLMNPGKLYPEQTKPLKRNPSN